MYGIFDRILRRFSPYLHTHFSESQLFLPPGDRFPPYFTRILGLGDRFPSSLPRVLGPRRSISVVFYEGFGPGRSISIIFYEVFGPWTSPGIPPKGLRSWSGGKCLKPTVCNKNELCSWSGGKCPKSNVSVIKMSMFWETFQNLDFRESQKAPGRSKLHFSSCGAAKSSPKLALASRSNWLFNAWHGEKSVYLLTYLLCGPRKEVSKYGCMYSKFAFPRTARRKVPLLTYLLVDLST